jgi:hypothetical protein
MGIKTNEKAGENGAVHKECISIIQKLSRFNNPSTKLWAGLSANGVFIFGQPVSS